MNAAEASTSQRAARWRLRTRTIEFPRSPLLMGIVNVTPDSFSDGGKYLESAAAVDHALRLVAEGADFLDVGGESTRPYSASVSETDELARVLPVIEKLAALTDRPISIDTSKALVAREAIAAGAEIINDVTGLLGDRRTLATALESQAGLCVMHMQGTPQTMQDDPRYDDVVADVHAFLRARRDALIAAGVDRERICLDPGIGFGKTHEHNLTLVGRCDRFHDLGCPLLVGHSRKAFIGKAIGDKSADRAAGTAGVAVALALQGVQVVRVHDVATVRQVLVLFEASGGYDFVRASVRLGTPETGK